MTTGIKVKLDHGGMGELLKSDDVRNGLSPYAEAVAAAMRANAPVESGALAASIHVVDDTTDRAVKRVVADTDYALIVEANTGFMARSLDAAGGF